MGQIRGAQSGEADRHAVWLAANNLEPKLSPFDPFAMLDEIQRLVPGYDILASEPARRQRSAHELAAERSNAGAARLWCLPANDTLFTSGTLGRYSKTLEQCASKINSAPADKEVTAD